MRIRLLTTTCILFLLLLFAACQNQESSQSNKPAETVVQKTFDSEGLKSFVDKYMDAMLAKDRSDALFTKGCIFTENGVRLPLGDEGLWSSMVGKGTYRFYVPDVETQQIGFFGTAREEAQNEGSDPSPVAIALRLKIENDLISEAEQLVIRPESNLLNPQMERGPSAAENIEKMGQELGNPHPVFTEVIPENERPSREEMIKTANYYFSGMQKNDGKGVDGTGTYPFTDDCDRYENGGRSTNVPLAPGQEMPDPLKETVYSSHWGCNEQFESGLIYFVTRIRDRRFVAVDREHGIVFSFCFFDHSAGNSRHFTTPDGRKAVEGPAEPWTWQVAELFKVENGKIRRIEAILQRCPYGMNSGWSTYEDGMSDRIQIIK
ncbi:MAG: hypothetical protein JXL81_14525 [Deltaproteobacteria bacterium]|nr:hypothetical protein [Deltaproteobacteria bacterium]